MMGRMGSSAGEERTFERRRYVTTWAVVFSLILVGFAATVIALNVTVFSASGFVNSYLGALERRDAAGALALPGVTVPGQPARELLQSDALGELSGIRIVDDVDEGGGTHRVTVAFDVGGSDGESEFLVEHTGARLGFFSAWRFAQTPMSTLQITPLGATRFEANGISVESAGGPGNPVAYGVLTPGIFSLSHDSELLTAEREDIIVLDPGARASVAVDAQANERFTKLVQDELDSALDTCAEQEVLQPTGCPFGQRITNRVEGVPEWSMTTYPQVTIVRGDQPGTWAVPETAGAARLTVGVRSLFDGTVSTFDEDVPFTVSYVISFQPGGGVAIVAQ